MLLKINNLWQCVFELILLGSVFLLDKILVNRWSQYSKVFVLELSLVYYIFMNYCKDTDIVGIPPHPYEPSLLSVTVFTFQYLVH